MSANSNSILDDLMQQIGPGTIQQMSRTLGADPAATSNAVSMAIPVIVGGLAKNASNPQGAASLDRALNAHDGSILDNLGGLLGGGETGAMGGMGGKILGHILGARRGPVEQGVGKASGLDAAQVAQLMAMLAPIVMGFLGRMKNQKGLDANQLPDVLAQGRAQGEQTLPGLSGMLDSNDDGSIADDLARIGTSMFGGMFGRK